MSRRSKKTAKKAGVSPGTLVYVGEKKLDQPLVKMFNYSSEHYLEKQVDRIEEVFPNKTMPPVSWINVSGLHDVNLLQRLGNHFKIHPLALEDIANTTQRPKIEEHDDQIFVVVKLLTYDENSHCVNGQQMSILVTSNYLLSFEESVDDIFNPMRDRIRTAGSRIRRCGTDYLLYRLLDAVVDNYFIALDKLGERIDALEEELIEKPTKDTLRTLYDLKRELLFLRKSTWPLREVISVLTRIESPLIKDATIVFLRDVYDHTVQVIDTIENFRDIAASMMDLYLSSLSHKLNETMKVLTTISTIFIPLTFIAGVYGMNFHTGISPWNMPELNWYFGYPIVMLVMLAIGVVMLFFFKKRGWF
ncbi:magnesium/cobalt transporter CorA [bacterium]|nr:magnesium/cobalt transporter CorA [bacterium]